MRSWPTCGNSHDDWPSPDVAVRNYGGGAAPADRPHQRSARSGRRECRVEDRLEDWTRSSTTTALSGGRSSAACYCSRAPPAEPHLRPGRRRRRTQRRRPRRPGQLAPAGGRRPEPAAADGRSATSAYVDGRPRAGSTRRSAASTPCTGMLDAEDDERDRRVVLRDRFCPTAGTGLAGRLLDRVVAEPPFGGREGDRGVPVPGDRARGDADFRSPKSLYDDGVRARRGTGALAPVDSDGIAPGSRRTESHAERFLEQAEVATLRRPADDAFGIRRPASLFSSGDDAVGMARRPPASGR